jgi:hypothetical protein
MTIKWDQKYHLSPEVLAKKLNVELEDIDEDFGLVSVDEEENIFSFRLSEKAYSKSNLKKIKELGGPFSDTKIEPFDTH